MKKIMLLILAVALLGGFWYYRSLTSGPEYSLLQAKEAAENHDLATFEKYVAVETLIGNLIDQLTADENGLNQLIPQLQLDQNTLNFIKPQLVNNATQEVQRFIVTGRVHASPTGTFFSLAALAGGLIGEDSEFKGIAYVKKENETAFVGLEITQPRYDTTLILEIKMLDKGDYWQATELSNTAELLQHLTGLEKQRLFR
jgi:hypothetical protein